MSYKISDNSIEVLKELYKDSEFKPLTSKNDVEELLFALAFFNVGGNLAKAKNNENSVEILNKINKCEEELKNNIDDLDLDYINNLLS